MRTDAPTITETGLPIGVTPSESMSSPVTWYPVMVLPPAVVGGSHVARADSAPPGSPGAALPMIGGPGGVRGGTTDLATQGNDLKKKRKSRESNRFNTTQLA